MEPANSNKSNKNTVIAVVVLLVLITAGILLWRGMRNDSTTVQNSNTSTQAQPEVTTEPASTSTATQATSTKTYTLADISKHAKSTDCWFAISGKVYDVTAFIKTGKHPGGPAIIQGCGKDATTLFETRPMGSGTPHSPKAHASLVNFYIGDLNS